MAVIKMRVSKLRKAKGVEDSRHKSASREPKEGQNSNPKRANGEAPVEPQQREVCALCDDGGDLICCDGGCLRSFHPTKEHGERSMCTTLGLNEAKWQKHKALGEKGLYFCKNCKHKQHQCFACGLLGSSNLTAGPEVFKCKHQKCGHFYHPGCVAEILYPDNKSKATCFEQCVAGGLEFSCPAHKCKRCKEAENKHDKEMQFAICRRCPTAYHRKCLPRDISFIEDNEEATPQRAWDGILPDQILIYCRKHEIQKELGTPKRDHIVFPDVRNPCAAERHRGAPQEHGILDEDELLHRLASCNPSQSPRPAETDRGRVKPIDSFAPKHLFPRPQPGSCGWLDD